MPIKLMLRVRPGAELTCASFCCSRELIRLDLPTLERPRKANSGGPGAGKARGSAAEVMNLACMDFIRRPVWQRAAAATNPPRRHGEKQIAADSRRLNADHQ